MLDIEKIRKDFPILSREIYGRPLVYLDNGATTQKPLCVLDAMRDEYLNVNANVHRGVHWLSQQATDLHEAARETVRKFVNARSTSEIVFTRGTTESLNLVASSFVEGCMEEGDEVIVSTMEHHSNIVPWQLQQQRKNIRLRVIPMSDDGALLLDEYEKLFSEKTKLVSVMHVSNVLGTVNPVKEIIRIARKIDTFETSILPYEDCCTVFTPRHPKTRPHVEEVREMEQALDVEGLLRRAMDGREVVKLR